MPVTTHCTNKQTTRYPENRRTRSKLFTDSYAKHTRPEPCCGTRAHPSDSRPMSCTTTLAQRSRGRRSGQLGVPPARHRCLMHNAAPVEVIRPQIKSNYPLLRKLYKTGPWRGWRGNQTGEFPPAPPQSDRYHHCISPNNYQYLRMCHIHGCRYVYI